MNNYQRKHKNKLDYKSFMYYTNFKDLYPDIKINQAIHTKIIKKFFEVVVYEMITSMFRFQFPSLGLFYITKEPPKIVEKSDGTVKVLAPINWPETMRIRKLTGDNTRRVMYLNNHTRSYIYKFHWEKKHIPFTNRTFYSFLPCTNARVKLKECIESNVKPLDAYVP